jgi:hypothetical protein
MTTETYDKKPKFDPNKPFEPVDEKPKFDPNKPFEAADESSKKKESSQSIGIGEDGQSQFPTSMEGVLRTAVRGTKPPDEKNKFIKPLEVPISIDAGVNQDKKANHGWAGVYNMLVGSVAEYGGGLAELHSTLQENLSDSWDEMNGLPVGTTHAVRKKMAQAHPEGGDPVGIPNREQTENFINKARSAKSSRENERKMTQFDVTDGVQKKDVTGMLLSAPKTLLDLVGGAASGGTTFFAQQLNNSAKELEETGNADKLNSGEKLQYIVFQGTLQAAFEKAGLDEMLKATGLGSKIKQQITNKIIGDFKKKGIKATTEQIEKAVLREVSSIPSQIKRVGLKGLGGAGAELTTEGLQKLGEEGTKLSVNQFKGEIFDSEDIKANLIKNVINASAMGGVFGTAIGGSVGVASNTKKAIRKQISQVQTPEDLKRIQQEIAQQVELGNITEQEAEAANITAQQYAEVAATIPQEIDAEKKYALIGGIEQREELKKTIEETQKEIGYLDEAFHEEPKARIELLNAKLEQTNDYIDGLVAGKKVTYKKDGEEYFKTMPDGQVKPISKQHYELGVAIREEDAAKNKKPEIKPDDQKTFTFDHDEDVPPQLEKTQPIALQEVGGKIEATYSGEQLIDAGLATKEVTPLDNAKTTLTQAVEKGKLTGMYAEMAATNPEAVLQDISKQAQNLKEDFTPLDDKREDASREAAEDTFGNKLVEAAIAAYPAQPKAEGVVPSLKDELGQKSGQSVQVGDGKIKSSRGSGIEALVHPETGLGAAVSAILKEQQPLKDAFLKKNGLTIEDYRKLSVEEKEKLQEKWVKSDEFKQLQPQQPKAEGVVPSDALKLPENWEGVKGREVDVPILDPQTGEYTREKMNAEEAYNQLSKQSKILDKVLICITK